MHTLLPSGARILEELFPGILDELVTAGAPVWNDGDLSKLYFSLNGHEFLRSGKLAVDPAQLMALYMPSRPLLECHARRRVKAIRQVTIQGGQDVVALTATADRARITGVRVIDRDSGAEREIMADLVVDAMGRAAHTPAFLEGLGYGRPIEDRVVMHTTYVSQLLRIPPGTLKEMLCLTSPAPGRPTGMFLFGYENNTWMFSVCGCSGTSRPAIWPECCRSPRSTPRHTC